MLTPPKSGAGLLEIKDVPFPPPQHHQGLCCIQTMLNSTGPGEGHCPWSSWSLLGSLFFPATGNNRSHLNFLNSKRKENILSVFIALKPFHTISMQQHISHSLHLPFLVMCTNHCGLEYGRWGGRAHIFKTSKNIWNCFLTPCNLTPVGSPESVRYGCRCC